MPKIFTRTDTKTAKKTFAIYQQTLTKDRRRFWFYTTIIPLHRLLSVVLLPFLMSVIIQSLITHPHAWQVPGRLLGIALIVSILGVITSHYGFKALFEHEEKLRTSLTKRAITALIAHSDQFFSNRKVGSLAGDVNTFGASIITFLDVLYLQASGILVNFIASLVIIGFMSPILLIPLALATALLIWRSLVAVAARAPLRHERKMLSSQLNGTIADILGNQQIVRYFASSSREVNRIIQDRHAIEKVAETEVRTIQREMSVRQSTVYGFQIITMGVCIWLFSFGAVSIAALIFAITYLSRLTSAIVEITPVIRGVEQAFLDASSITEILSEEPEVVDMPDAPKLVTKKGAIVLSDISFHYTDHQDDAVINHVSLSVTPGEHIGLAGHSGGGKTTLTKLLLQFADVTDGSIAIDGQDIRQVSQESLREAIAYVPQEPYLFHRSLRDNIAYARPEASDKEIMRAIKQANAYEFIKDLPGGIDTIVGDRGVKLSGGQRQRIAIARAILKNAPILVLDEATSALDSVSEKLIQDALAKLMKNRTSIVVAHRLSTISSLDRIVVLDHGRIIEEGSHNKLLDQQGVYSTLWSHQSGGRIEE